MKIFNLIITTKKKQDDFIISCMQRLDRGFKMLKSAKHDTELMKKLDELGK